MAEVYLNGKFVGEVENPARFAERLRTERRAGALSKNINVYYNKKFNAVFIESERGRARRTLIVVENGVPLLTDMHIKQLEKGELTLKDLAKQGIIEELDAAEEENALVAFEPEQLTPEHTHLEFTPLAMLGLSTSLIPYSNYSQAPRINIASKNLKQAIGFYAANFHTRIDMDVNLLHYPQTPIVKTKMHELYNDVLHPAGQNIVVAVMSYEGYNMDDAVMLNRASVERGLGRSTYYRPATAEELKYPGGLVDEIAIPQKDVKGYRSEHDYRHLEKDGIIFPEAKVHENDVVVGKTSPPRFLSSLDEYNLAGITRRESSVALAHGEKGVVDFVLITESEEGNKLVQVKIREERIPEIGDKFTSRHGQKGVVGLLLPEGDMPFSASGIIPDLIFSPHSIPSRMTISHLIELIGGKVGALAGRYVDGTTFKSEPEAALREELLRLGFRENGVETFYNGQTGKQFKARIFVGNMYYLKLRHMVANKIHARARGPIQLLTRQPTEGKAKEGGLRLGEMEKDTFVSHGAALLLKERFDSDRTIVPICKKCGLLAVYDVYKNKSFCPACGENVDISNIEMSYAFKLALDEFQALGIITRLKLKTKY